MMGKKNKYGNFICAVGYLSIRQNIVMPKKKKNYQGKWEMTPGSSEVFVYHTKHKMAGPFKGKNEAVKKAEELLLHGIKYDKHTKS